MDVYSSFTRAAQRGDSKVAYALVSSRAQRLLAERAKQVSSASGGAVRDDPAALAFSASARTEPVTELKLVSQTGERATLSVKAAGRTSQVSLVKEQTGWKVDFGD